MLAKRFVAGAAALTLSLISFSGFASPEPPVQVGKFPQMLKKYEEQVASESSTKASHLKMAFEIQRMVLSELPSFRAAVILENGAYTSVDEKATLAIGDLKPTPTTRVLPPLSSVVSQLSHHLANDPTWVGQVKSTIDMADISGRETLAITVEAFHRSGDLAKFARTTVFENGAIESQVDLLFAIFDRYLKARPDSKLVQIEMMNLVRAAQSSGRYKLVAELSSSIKKVLPNMSTNLRESYAQAMKDLSLGSRAICRIAI